MLIRRDFLGAQQLHNFGTIGNEASSASSAAGGGGATLNVVLAAQAFRRLRKGSGGGGNAELDRENIVLCSGWLLKTPVEKPGDSTSRRADNKAKRRWFVLRGRQLEYFADASNSGTKKGHVGLTYDTTCRDLDQSKLLFELSNATVTKGGVEYVGGTMILQAETAHDKLTWFQALRAIGCPIESDSSVTDGRSSGIADDAFDDGIDDGTTLDLWTWGANDCAQLGIRERSTTGRAIPQLNVSLKNKFQVREISLGIDHAACVTYDWSVFTWGSNE